MVQYTYAHEHLRIVGTTNMPHQHLGGRQICRFPPPRARFPDCCWQIEEGVPQANSHAVVPKHCGYSPRSSCLPHVVAHIVDSRHDLWRGPTRRAVPTPTSMERSRSLSRSMPLKVNLRKVRFLRISATCSLLKASSAMVAAAGDENQGGPKGEDRGRKREG